MHLCTLEALVGGVFLEKRQQRQQTIARDHFMVIDNVSDCTPSSRQQRPSLHHTARHNLQHPQERWPQKWWLLCRQLYKIMRIQILDPQGAPFGSGSKRLSIMRIAYTDCFSDKEKKFQKKYLKNRYTKQNMIILDACCLCKKFNFGHFLLPGSVDLHPHPPWGSDSTYL